MRLGREDDPEIAVLRARLKRATEWHNSHETEEWTTGDIETLLQEIDHLRGIILELECGEDL